MTTDTCVFQQLSRKALQEVEEQFPSVFSRVYEKIAGYNDEDMAQRYLFMHNIPYFRGLDLDTIRPLAFLMKQ